MTPFQTPNVLAGVWFIVPCRIDPFLDIEEGLGHRITRGPAFIRQGGRRGPPPSRGQELVHLLVNIHRKYRILLRILSGLLTGSCCVRLPKNRSKSAMYRYVRCKSLVMNGSIDLVRADRQPFLLAFELLIYLVTQLVQQPLELSRKSLYLMLLPYHNQKAKQRHDSRQAS